LNFFLLQHSLSLVEKVLTVLHEIDFFEEEVSLLLAQTFLGKHLSSSLLKLVVGPLDLLDIDLLFL
jgi:hypothetical protein